MQNWLDRIKELKQKNGQTNESLSNAAGIPLGTLNKILSGVSDDPKLSTLVSLSDVFNVTLDYIARGDDSVRLSESELSILKKYRALDFHGRELAELVLDKEYERAVERPGKKAAVLRTAPIRYKYTAGDETANSGAVMKIPLYHLPVSAGRGALLDGAGADHITVTSGGAALSADFALRVSGNSMEPRYIDGDIILVHSQTQVGIGELGIYVCDDGVVTEGYFKRFGGDRLISLNPEYDDIYLDRFVAVSCRGKVIGRLPRKKSI